MSKESCPECKSYLLESIPQDVWSIIIDEQANASKKNGRIGKEAIIYKIIRKYVKQKEESSKE